MSVDQDKQAIAEMIRQDYAMLSGPAGPRDYDSVKHHYHQDARLIRTGIDESGRPFVTVMTVDEHHADVNRKLSDIAFVEEELSHDCEVFGNVARVRSVYRSVYGSGDDMREGRGVNFFNLIRDKGVWKIVSIVWDNERPGLSLGAL